MITQLLTLVGVIVGALASFFATAMAERAKFRREIATRWDERKLDAYIQYTSHIKEMMRDARVVLRLWRAGEDRTDALLALETLESRRSVLFEGLVLLADEDAAAVANRLNERTWDLLGLARDPDGDNGTPKEVFTAVVDALNELHRAAKADLQMERAKAIRSPGSVRTAA